MSIRRVAFLVLGTWYLVLGSAEAQITKLDPLIRHLAKEGMERRTWNVERGTSKALSVNAQGDLIVDCFVVVYNPAKAQTVADQIGDRGGKVRSIIEDVMTASIPLEVVEEIASWPDVKYVEAGKPCLPKMDTARTTTNVDDVNAGTNLDKRYDGSGVIVGIVDDTRPDFGHDDFEDSAGKTRVKFYWDKNGTGSGVAEISGSSGLECTKAEIDATTCTASGGGDTTSHSTHVAGIAAGDDGTFKGVASGADIIFVFNVETDADSGGNLSTTIVDDVRYVFAKASAAKQPAVVNLSLGTSIGAHDDTSSMEKSLNNLIADHPGRAIVNAAGNENFNPNYDDATVYAGIHAPVSTTSGTDNAFDFAVDDGATVRSLGRKVIADVWLNSASTCTVELDAFDFAKTAISLNMAAVSAGASGSASGAAGTSGTITLNVDFTDSTNANNGKRHAIATMTFTSGVTNAQIQGLSFDLIFRGACTGDIWIWPDRPSTVAFTKRYGGTNRGFGYTYVDGDSNRTITIPGTASKIITAGAFMSKGSWTDINGTTHNQTANSGSDFSTFGATGGTLSALSLFSSIGPTADGRRKPDISAPGEAIVSSMASNVTTDSVPNGKRINSNHFKLEGTSMASPHVAGIVALIFQKNPCLTSNQVKTLITNNAATDSATGTALPNDGWGYGKVDALAIMQDVVTLSGTTCGLTGSTGKQDTPVTTTSGEAGGGGCVSIAGRGNHGGVGLWVIFVLLLLTIRISNIKSQTSK